MIALAPMLPSRRCRRRLPSQLVRLEKFERRLGHSELTAEEEEILHLAQALARPSGHLDLHLLASRAGRALHIIQRRRAALDTRGLWPWRTDKCRVGPPWCGFGRETAAIRRRIQALRATRVPPHAAESTAVGANPPARTCEDPHASWCTRPACTQPESTCTRAACTTSAACAFSPLREICQRYLDEFREIQRRPRRDHP